ncbi:flagellar hook-basal body complex protein FliE [bacterium]|nr:flagellar hook-basal body complex protein FliE [bacterium]
MTISSISPLTTSGLQGVSQSVKTTASNQSESLGNTFNQVLNSLNDSQTNVDSLVTQLSTGKDVDVADVMIASTQNDVNFRVAMAIRDRLVDAYREVMRMNI